MFTFEASMRGGANASLLAQHLDWRLDLVDHLWIVMRVVLAIIPSVDEGLCNSG